MKCSKLIMLMAAGLVLAACHHDVPLGPGEEGSRTALPVWVQFMQRALDGVPENQMPMPPGILRQRIDRETGCPARAGQRNTTFELFREGNVPVCEQLDEVPDILNEGEEGEEPREESLF